jgi:hypothetical protein
MDEDIVVFFIYIATAAVFFIAGLIVMFTGMATDKKPLKLAGIVIAVMAFQIIAIMGFFLLLAVLTST